MGQQYEVQFVKRLDGTDQHGNVTDSVKFATEEQTALWTHKPETEVIPGMKAYGRIEERTSRNGNTYYKFVREQQEPGFTPQPSTPQADSGKFSSNSDGMRQGMSINNATAVLIALIGAGAYTKSDPKEVASDIQGFAKEIYKIDLTEPETPTVEDIDKDIEKVENGTLLDDINDIFPGASKAVPANG